VPGQTAEEGERRRREQLHRANWLSLGSAQQNHGSVSRGGMDLSPVPPLHNVERGSGGEAGKGRSVASDQMRRNVRAGSSRERAASATSALTSRCSWSIRVSGCVQR